MTDIEEFFAAVDEAVAAGRVSLQFWLCPIAGHSDSDWRNPRETVRWIGDVAHCTWPGCGRTSADPSPIENGHDTPGEPHERSTPHG